jgi:chorismate mutase
MMIDEQDNAILRLVKERGEAKRRRAALERELRAAGKSLCDIGGALKNSSVVRFRNGIDNVLPKLQSVPAICDLSRVTTMLEELKEVETRLAQLNRIAAEMGID